MEELLAYVGAELRKPEEEISDELVAMINDRIKPPKLVTKEEIFVRTMYLVSDEINSYGGCFPLEELHNLTNLVIDSPVMIGHTKEKLPIARNFKAEVVQKDNKNWVKVWFYWLKNSKDAFSLKENIDHGIYKECSLGFVFEFPECSICGEDMRKCQHIPFKTYPEKQNQQIEGTKVQEFMGSMNQGSETRLQETQVAFFNYRNVTRVLETSLVYRGAVPNTSMSDELWLLKKCGKKEEGGETGKSAKLVSNRIYRDIVEKALQQAGILDQVKLVGGVVDLGYSDHDIDIICLSPLEALVLGALPPGLQSRVHFVQDLGQTPTEILPLEFVSPTKPNKTNSISNEIFHLEDLDSLSGEFLIEPKYDGVRTQVHRKDNEVRIFTDEGNRIEEKFPHLEKDALSYPHESYILDGELVKYKGNSRLSHKEVAGYIHSEVSSKRNNPHDDFNFKFKLFDLLYLEGKDQTSLPLEQRKKLLEDFFPDTNFIQKVKYEKANTQDLSQGIKNISTSEGAMIKKSDSGYFESENWYKWKRYLDLDVLITGVQENKGGSYNYACAVGNRANPIPIGTTYSTSIQAKTGDIIRVRVDYVTKTDDRFAWYAPRVVDIRSDKKETDPIAVLERMSTVHGRQSTVKNLLAVDSRQSTMDKFVLQLHWWGEAKHHDLRFLKGKVAIGLTLFEMSIEELNQGKRFLCEWKDYHDPKWMEFEGEIPPQKDGIEENPSKNLVAHMKILDRGEYQFLERKEDFSRIQIQGKILNGIYLVRKVSLKGKERWLFWKSTQGQR